MTVGSPPASVSVPITNLQFQRNIAPSEDNASITLAGIQPIQSAREVYIYRVNSDGTLTLKFRGMTTNPTFHVADDALVTTVEVASLWYMFQTRLFGIAGKSPPPLQPNTNPYLVYLNPTLGLNFGVLWSDIVSSAFQGSYSTGHLPTIHLANLLPDGSGNINVGIIPPYLTDFDAIVVNDNMNIQYQSIDAVINRLVQSALFNANQSQPFLSEYRLDIGDYPINLIQTYVRTSIGSGSTNIDVTSVSGFASGQTVYVGYGLTTQETMTVQTVFIPSPNLLFTLPLAYNHYAGEIVETTTSLSNLYNEMLPTVTVMLFDPTHSKLGNGNNRTGICLGDNSIDPQWVTGTCGPTPTPSGLTLDELAYPMSYIEFGVYNGYCPIDTIIFSEGDNIVSIDLTYDYTVMNNSYVLTGGSFQGSDVVTLPIDNQRSIAEYGLKQTTQSLSNVVDQGEIARYVGTSINFFQHPIPNIVIKPDYVYASTHTMYAGDYILVNAPSLKGVVEDSNGNLLEASYSSIFPYNQIVLAFTARIKTIDITWNPTDGEDITLTLTFPVQNVPIGAWQEVTMNKGSVGGAMQFMYTTVQPAAKTMLGRGRQAEGGATYQAGADFITNKASPQLNEQAIDGSVGTVVDTAILPVILNAQVIPNNVSVVDGTGQQVKGDDVLIYQFLTENNLASGLSSSTTNAWMTVIQPDGMTIFDDIIALGQQSNILSLLSKSHKTFVYTFTHNLNLASSIGDNSFTLNDITGIETGDYITIYDPPSLPSASSEVLQVAGISSHLGNTILTVAPATKAHIFGSIVQQTDSAPFVGSLTGQYMILLRNVSTQMWCPVPLFTTLLPPSVTITSGGANVTWFLYCPVGADGSELGISPPIKVNGFADFTMTWVASPNPLVVGYNVYISTYPPISGSDSPITFWFCKFVNAPSFTFSTATYPTGLPLTQPYPPSVGFTGNPASGSVLSNLNAQIGGNTYWYVITAVNPTGTEVEYSAAGAPTVAVVPGYGGTNAANHYPRILPTTDLTGNYTGATATAGSSTTVLQDSGVTGWVAHEFGLIAGVSQNLWLTYTPPAANAGEYRLIVDNGTHSISTDPAHPFPYTLVVGDPYQIVLGAIEISWPTVPEAQSYYIYRAGPYSVGDPLSPQLEASYNLLQDGGTDVNVTTTSFTDDGSYTPTGAILGLYDGPYVGADNNTYQTFLNVSFHPNPAKTASISNTSNFNPATSITYNPIVQRTYPPFRYPV
jgi:hypothetical protein